jgi:hypothetical protein
MTEAPPPPRPTVPPLGPVIEGTVVEDSLAGVPGANLPPAHPAPPGPTDFSPAPPGPTGFSPAPPGAAVPGPAPQATAEPLIQQPVMPSFILGAVYGFLARTVAFLLSVSYISPVNGMFTALLRSINRPAGLSLMLGEFLVLGVAALAAVVVGVTARPEDRPSFTRALFFGRVYFWATCWYLATIVLGGVYVIATDTVGGGIWLLLLSLLSIPSLFTARKIIHRSRWAGRAPR